MGRSNIYSRRQRENKSNETSQQSNTILQGIRQGFGLGLGLSVANAVVDRTIEYFSPRTINIQGIDKCKVEQDELDRCLKQNSKEHKECYELLEKYNKCKSS